MVTLINKSKRMKVYNLDTPEMVAAHGKKKTVHKLELGRDGGRYPMRVQKVIAGSLTLCAGEKISRFPGTETPLPDSIMKIPAIAADIKKGHLRCIAVSESKPAKKATAENKGDKSRRSGRGRK